MELLTITDLTKLKFTKVKGWKVYFDYEDQHYMLLDDSDEDAHLSLYRRKIDNGKVTVTWLNGKVTSLKIYSIIKDISKRRPTNLVYTNIDREYFVKKLVELGFTKGLFEKEYDNKQNQELKIKEEINRLNIKLLDTSKEWEKTRGHGSKCYTSSLKIKVADRITPAKDGDWCEQLQDYYGNKSKQYGGILTDLFSLSVGTKFYVTNGCYDAIISVNEHGNKCIITDCSCVELNGSYHSAYILK